MPRGSLSLHRLPPLPAARASKVLPLILRPVLQVMDPFQQPNCVLRLLLLLRRAHLKNWLRVSVGRARRLQLLQVGVPQHLAPDHDVETQLLEGELYVVKYLAHYYDLLLVHNLSVNRHVLKQAMDIKRLLCSNYHRGFGIDVISMQNGISL